MMTLNSAERGGNTLNCFIRRHFDVIFWIVVASVVSIMAYSLSYYTCSVRATKQGYAYDFDFIGGCYYEENGKFIAEDRLRVTK